MIAIVDYGMGNLGSILNMLSRLGAEAEITADKNVIRRATKLILPGVGAFDSGMTRLHGLGLTELLNSRVLGERTPVLGICLGLQLMTRKSEEGGVSGLGWLPADTVRFCFSIDHMDLKVPHMGWNEAVPRRSHWLFQGLGEEARFYFVHSYHLRCDDGAVVLSTTNHGYDFPSAVAMGNILGTQFHPEKSHRFGKTLLKNFAEADML